MTMTTPIDDRSKQMNEESWWDLWNTSYRVVDEGDPVSSELFARAAAIINGITQGADARVLEIACGTGKMSRMISCSAYHGLDISPAAVEVARQKWQSDSPAAGKNSPIYEAIDFHEWPLPQEPFDVVICIDAISSIREQDVAMRKMAQALRSGGRLVLTTINRFVYDRIHRTGGVKLESGPVSQWLSLAELTVLVRNAGFSIDQAGTIMPRGKKGFLRVVNSYRLNSSFGPGVEAALKRFKERIGLGQYSVIVAHKR